MNPSEVLKMAEENKVVMVDLRFIDWPGMWQHFSVPISELSEEAFEDGFGFDGSSIRGWQKIHNSDMLVIPDPSTAKMDPFFQHPTLVMICNIVDPITKEPYSRDPRHIAQKAEAFLKSTGMADTALSLVQKQNFSCSTMYAMKIRPISVMPKLIRLKDIGIQVLMKVPIWVINRVIRKVTSPCRQTIPCKISVLKWFS